MRSVLMISRLCAIFWLQCLWAANGLDTWTLRSSPLPSTNWLYAIIYANGQFVAVGGTSPATWQGAGVILRSTDGTSWTQATIPGGTGTLRSVTSGQGTYVAAGRTIINSLDGKSWGPSLSGGSGYSAVAHGNNLFVAASYPYIYISTNNANTWTRYPLAGFEFSLSLIAFGNDEFVAVGGHGGVGGISTSTNGTMWSGKLSDYLVRSICYGGGIYVAVGGKGTMKVSPETTTWTTGNSGTTNNLLGVGFGGGVFVAVGSRGTILTSTDATTWAPRASSVTNDLTAVAFGNGHFVAVGANGTILESGAVLHLGQSKALSNGAFQLTLTGASGQRCEVQSSPDLTNWTELTEFVLAEPSITIVITSPTNFSQRFYRAVAP